MSAFFGQEFLTAQYFRPNYLHGAGGVPPAQDGRSGYWRLFFMQAQEEALKEKTDEKVAEHSRSVDSPKVVVRKGPVRKKRITQAEPRTQEKPLDLPPFKRIPVYTTPSTYEKLANLPVNTLSQDVRALTGKIYDFAQHLAAKKKRNSARRRAVAFLLMAA